MEGAVIKEDCTSMDPLSQDAIIISDGAPASHEGNMDTTELESEVVEEAVETLTTDTREQKEKDHKVKGQGEEKSNKPAKAPPAPVPCKVCDMLFNSQSQADAHFLGKKHKAKLGKNKPAPRTSPAPRASPVPRLNPAPRLNPVPKPPLINTFYPPKIPMEQIYQFEASGNIVCYLCNKGFFLANAAVLHFQDPVHQAKEREILERQRIGPQVNSQDMNSINLNQQLTCNICDTAFNSVSQIYAHFTGRKHKAKEAMLSVQGPPIQPNRKRTSSSEWPNAIPDQKAKLIGKDPSSASQGYPITPVDAPLELYCKYCDVTVNSHAQLQRHNAGIKHKLQTGEVLEPPEWWIEREKQREGKDKVHKGQLLRCELCNITVNSQEQLSIHLKGRVHRMNTDMANGIIPPQAAPQGDLFGQRRPTVLGRGNPRSFDIRNNFVPASSPGAGHHPDQFSGGGWQPPSSQGPPAPRPAGVRPPGMKPPGMDAYSMGRGGPPPTRPHNGSGYGSSGMSQNYDRDGGQSSGNYMGPYDCNDDEPYESDSMMMGGMLPEHGRPVSPPPPPPVPPYMPPPPPSKSTGYGRGMASSRGRGAPLSGYSSGWAPDQRY